TFLPFSRASDRPIAIACLRLVTFRPLRPLRNVPFLRLRIARSTSFDALREYLRAMRQLRCRRQCARRDCAPEEDDGKTRTARPPRDDVGHRGGGADAAASASVAAALRHERLANAAVPLAHRNLSGGVSVETGSAGGNSCPTPAPCPPCRRTVLACCRW